MGRNLRVAVSLALSAFFLWLSVRGISWDEVGDALARAHWGWTIPMAIPAVVSLWCRAMRWGIFIRPMATVKPRPLLSATSIGSAANMLLPLRAGEVLKPWVLARKEGVPFASVMATVAVERLFDMATLALFFFVATLSLPIREDWQACGKIFYATFAVFLLALVLLVALPDRVVGLASVVLRPLPSRFSDPLLGLLRQFQQGLTSLGSASAIAAACVWSLLVWVGIALSFGFGFYAFDLDVPLLEGSLVVGVMVAIAVSIPGGPGFIGMFQAGCVAALSFYGVPQSVAFSYSLVTHLVQFSISVAMGLFFFLREDLSMSDMTGVGGAHGGTRR